MATIIDENTVEITHCEALIANPRRNPITGRAINPWAANGVFDKFQKVCMEKHQINITPARTPRSSRSSGSSGSPRAPARTPAVPAHTRVTRSMVTPSLSEAQTVAMKMKAIYREIERIQRSISEYGNVINRYEAEGYQVLFSSETEIPVDMLDMEELKRFKASFEKFLESSKKWDSVLDSHKNYIDQLKLNVESSLAFINQQLSKKPIYGRPKDLQSKSRECAREFILKGSSRELVLMYSTILENAKTLHQYFKNIYQQARKAGNYLHPKITINIINLDDAIEIASDVKMIDETISLENQQPGELSDSSNESDTISSGKLGSTSSVNSEKSKYRKLRRDVNMSGSKADLSPLPNKSYKELLRGLKETCIHMHDLISLKEFRKMPKKQLKLIVRLGETGKQRCYYVRNLYNKWRTDAASKKQFTDALRNPITSLEQEEIMKKVRYIDPKARDLRDKNDKAFMKHVELVFVPSNHKPMIPAPDGTMTEAPFSYSLMNIVFRVKTKGYSGSFQLPNSTIPAEVEVEETKSTDLTSAVLMYKLTKLFKRGLILIENKFPLQCCKIHLNKPADYWFDPESPSGIDLEKFKKMMDEVSIVYPNDLND